MTTGQYLWKVLVDLIWPPKGIIYVEVQLLMRAYTLAAVWLEVNMPSIISVAAIIFVIGIAVFGHTRPHMPRGFGVHRILGTLMRLITNILFAWGFLIYGALAGQPLGTHGEENARISYSRRIHTGPVWNVVHSFTRMSLHFHIGRWLFRFFYQILGGVSRENRDDRARIIIARCLALVVIFWGIWNIPYDLTH